MRNILLLFLVFIPFLHCHSQEENLNSTLYFGPNALPVPDMLDGTVSKTFNAELCFDLHRGFYGDLTKTIFAKVNIPLFTPRVNLSVWMPVVEFYKNTISSLNHQNSVERKIKGYEYGNVYVSTDIHMLVQNRIRPDISLRIGLITASGDSDQYSRFFDSPAYFFDTSIAKSLLMDESFFYELRFVFNLGFLCWQVDKVTQNDAYMYGVKGVLNSKLFSFSVACQGYSGWIGNGDRPIVFKSNIVFNYRNFHPIIGYQYGIRDYPYHQYRIGLGYTF